MWGKLLVKCKSTRHCYQHPASCPRSQRSQVKGCFAAQVPTLTAVVKSFGALRASLVITERSDDFYGSRTRQLGAVSCPSVCTELSSCVSERSTNITVLITVCLGLGLLLQALVFISINRTIKISHIILFWGGEIYMTYVKIPCVVPGTQ